MKKKINKNKLIILVSTLVLLIIIVAGVSNLAYRLHKKNNKTDKVEEKLNMEKEAKELLYNNFIIGYMLEDDVETGEGELVIDGDPTVYYAVTDPLLKDIHTLEDINNLIDENLNDLTAVRVNKLMKSDYANKYVSNGKTLYVSKTNNGCAVSPFGLIDKDKIEYSNYEGNIYAIYNNVPYQVQYDDNQKLKARALWFKCSEALSYTNTGLEDVYDPGNIPEDVQQIMDNRVTDTTTEKVENGEN